jgi:hypothetical protein
MSDSDLSPIQKYRLARLLIWQSLGILERWIKWRIKTSTLKQLFQAERDLMDLARTAQKGRASLALVHQTWSTHPLQQNLFEERLRREFLLENNSDDYLGHQGSRLSTTDIRDYLIWKQENNRFAIENQKVVHKYGTLADWQKDKRRTLTVLKRENEGKEISKDNGRLSSIGKGVDSPRPNHPNSLESHPPKIQGQRAYGPGKKTNPVGEAEKEKI